MSCNRAARSGRSFIPFIHPFQGASAPFWAALDQVILWQNSVEERLAKLARLLSRPDKQIGEKCDISPCNGSREGKHLSILLCNIHRSSLKDVLHIRWDLTW